MVKEINTYTHQGARDPVVARNGDILFAAGGSTHGTELWRSDGTANGTLMVKEIRPGPFGSSPSSLTEVNGLVFFAASDGAYGTEVMEK